MLLKQNIPISYVFGKIKNEMALLTIYSAAVYVAHTYYDFPDVSIPLAIPSILGTIISLLLAFRSNQAYDRWWEARTIWGAIVNDSRSFARQVLSFIDNSYDDEDKSEMKKRMIKRQMAWCYSLSQHLRGQNPHEYLHKFVSEDEKKALAPMNHVPLALMEMHANDLRLLLRMGWINEYQQVSMDETLTRFSNAMGACERIKNTVFPATYSVYIHFLVLFFVLLLPFGLIEHFGIFQIPLVVAISSSFFLIEKMAIHLQDPFENKPTDTPTTTISRKIEQDLRQLLKDEFPPESDTSPSVPKNSAVFYIL
jgi:putative membrane protein